MKKNVIHFFVIMIATTACVFSTCQAQSNRPLLQNERFRARIQQRLQETGIDTEVEDAILAGIAFYPDEVIAAIFEVAQEPEHLMAGTVSDNPAFNEAYKFLSDSPEVLNNLKTHPVATRIVGFAAAADMEKAWAEIDAFRARYAKRSGIPVSAAATSENAPPAIAVGLSENAEVAGATETTRDVVVVNFDPTYAYIVAEGGAGEVVYGYPYPYAYPTAAVVYAGEAAAAGGALVTDNGVVAGAGYAAVDTEDGTFQSGATVAGVNSQGEGFVAHREGEGSYDANGFERSGEGQIQTTTGQGAEWETARSGELTEDGFNAQSSKSLEANNGASVESDRSVEYGDDGLDVDRSGSATEAHGQSYEWGNSGNSDQRQAAQSRLGANPQMSQNKSGWDFFQGQTPGQASSRFARSGEAAKSAQSFSGKNLGAGQLDTAMVRGNLQQGRTFGSLDKSNRAAPSSFKRSASQPQSLHKPNLPSSAVRSRGAASGAKSGVGATPSRNARSYSQGGGGRSLRGGGGGGRRR